MAPSLWIERLETSANQKSNMQNIKKYKKERKIVEEMSEHCLLNSQIECYVKSNINGAIQNNQHNCNKVTNVI